MNRIKSYFSRSILQRPWLLLFLSTLFFQASTAVGQNDAKGKWSPVYTGDMIPVACANLPDGKILAWSAKDRNNFGGNNGRTYTSIFNPSNNRFSTTLISNTKHDMFCPGTANIGNGEIIITGGASSEKTTIYNPANNSWRNGPDMNTPRGYHSMNTLSDGRVFALGGSWSGGRFDKKAEVWSANTGWVTLDNVTSNNTVTQGAPDPEGIYRSDNHAWLWSGPNGRVFQAGPGTNMHWISTSGDGSVSNAGNRGNDKYAMNGTCVMYDKGKILSAGGATSYARKTNASNRSYVIDINGGGAKVSRSDNMNRSRTLHNSVVLPNGEVVIVGGNCKSIIFSDECARLIPEIWNPKTGKWRDGRAMKTPRTYHSVAILMKDGRVWVGGGGLCGKCDVNHLNAEIYTPPYLYNGNSLAARPSISSVPGKANYNSKITVKTNKRVQDFVLMRLSSATHSINNEQRRIPLSASRTTGNTYSVSIPNRNWLPPGDYFLFALDDGVPSLGKTIRIGANSNSGGSNNTTQLIKNGTYHLEAVSGSQRLAAPSFDNINVRMRNRGTGNDQKWEIKHKGNNVYTLKNLRNNRYLNVTGGGCGNKTNVLTWTNGSNENSQWLISKSGNDYFLRPVHCTSQALDKNNGTNGNVHTWGYSTGNTNQRFKIISTSGTSSNNTPSNNDTKGVVTLFQNCNYDRNSVSVGEGNFANMPSIDFGNNSVSSVRVESGYQVKLYDGTNFGGGSITLTADASCLVQRGFNDKTSSLKVSRINGNSSTSRVQINGTYNIKSRANGLNIAAPSSGGFNVTTHSSASHRWTFKHIGNGVHTIQNVSTKRYLEVAFGECKNGANVNSWTASNREHHRWYIEKEGNNHFLLPMFCPTRALDKNNGNGKNAHIWTYNRNSKNQQFQLVSISSNRIANLDGGGIELLATPTMTAQAELSVYVPAIPDRQVAQYILQYIHEDQEEYTDLSVIQEEEVTSTAFEFLHDQPTLGKNYYRVKIEYADGRVDYTPHRIVDLEAPPAPITVMPNPVRALMQLDLSNYLDTPIYYFISSITGEVLQEGVYQANHSDLETIDLSRFENGNYFIYLRPEHHQEQVQRFIVLK